MAISTRILQVDPVHPEPETIQRAARILIDGGLVAFPTETVYGLGANALNPDAVRGIYAAKGRPSNNPIIVHVADAGHARQLASHWPDSAQMLAERFWPGPLTIVVPRSTQVPDAVAGGGPTVALRCSTHPVAQALIRASGLPVAAPSANRSSELSPTRAEHVLHGLRDRIDLLLDGGPTAAGIESTVVDLSGAVPRLLRPGPIPPGQLEETLGPFERMHFTAARGNDPLPSPGLLSRHYAPRTPLECCRTLEELRQRGNEALARGEAVGIVATVEPGFADRASAVIMPATPDRFAAELFRVLHDLDGSGLNRILVLLPPSEDQWLAVRDRLLRAATKE